MSKKENLKQLYLELTKRRTTKNSENQELDTITYRINELDAYYAGLALTASEGGKISLKSLYDIEELVELLKKISTFNQEDILLLEECRSFLKTLSQIDAMLRLELKL